MNDHLNDIYRFLDGKMSMEEAMSFMDKVSNDSQLRQLFEKELETHSLFEEELKDIHLSGDEPVEDIMFQPADEHIAMIEKGLTAEKKEQNITPVIPLYKNYKYIAAAAAIILLIFSDLYIFNPQHRTAIANLFNKQQPIKDTANNSNDSLPLPPSDIQQQDNRQIAALSGKELYSKYHTYYEGGLNDPAEISLPLMWYYTKKYKQVKDADPNDYITRGSENDTSLLYLTFYKAISLLEMSNEQEAIKYFDSVRINKIQIPVLTANNNWFTAMAWLKQDSLQKAKDILVKISSDKDSPFKAKADSVLKECK